MYEPEGRDNLFDTRANCWEAVSVLSWSSRGIVVLRVNVLLLSATPRSVAPEIFSVAPEIFLPKNEGLEVMENSGLLWGGRRQADPTSSQLLTYRISAPGHICALPLVSVGLLKASSQDRTPQARSLYVTAPVSPSLASTFTSHFGGRVRVDSRYRVYSALFGGSA